MRTRKEEVVCLSAPPLGSQETGRVVSVPSTKVEAPGPAGLLREADTQEDGRPPSAAVAGPAAAQ